jgi:hypothetical protein
MRTRPYIIACLALAAFGCADDSSSTNANAADSGITTPIDDAGTTDAEPDQLDAPDSSVDADAEPVARPYPEPGDWPPNRGPGGPNVAFTEAELYQTCAYLDGGERDIDHHNLVIMWDGYLMLPWAPEGYTDSGITFFEFDDPCSPVVVGAGESPEMRESHSIGIAQYEIDGQQRAFAVVDGIQGIQEGGIQFWDITDTTAPFAIGNLDLDGFFYPDAYRNVPLSVFWQAPYVYVGMGTQGIVVVDARDPENPFEVSRWKPEPVAQIGQVQVVGDLLIAGTAEGSRAFLLDVSDPELIQPIPGGDYPTADASGSPKEAYFSNFSDGYQWFARKEDGGGIMVYDVSDPTNPTYAGGLNSPDGNGGYVFVKDDLAFVGESRFAALYDVSDLENITEVTRLDLEGDLDTITPIGNVAVLSVDDKAVDGQGSSVVPYQLEVDTTPPRVTFSWPEAGADDLTPTSRIGVSFNEMVDPKSAWEGSVRLYPKGTDSDFTRVDGWISAQENLVNFFPKQPLERDTTYVFEIPAGGIVDYNGNAIAESFTMEVTTR